MRDATNDYPRFQFRPYGDTEQVANLVVDGAPNASTVLTLSHWPGVAQPPGFGADLSAEMAFKYLDGPPPHPAAEFVTNNHFDQDGLVGIHALVAPEVSLEHRPALIDVAAAGDFATYRFRSSARASMAISSYAQSGRSPLGTRVDGPPDEVCALLYEETLPLLLPMITEPDRFRDLWHEDDESLTASETALADGRVTIEKVEAVGLAVVTIGDDSISGGHRFTTGTSDLIHPMALNNATNYYRILLVRGREYLYIDRYETWVQYQSRRVPPRVDLRPLAEQLSGDETGPTTWTAEPPSTLTPQLRSDPQSSLSAVTVRDMVVKHLGEAPPAWDPFAVAS